MGSGIVWAWRGRAWGDVSLGVESVGIALVVWWMLAWAGVWAWCEVSGWGVALSGRGMECLGMACVLTSYTHRFEASGDGNDRSNGQGLRRTNDRLYLVGLAAGHGSWDAAALPPRGVGVGLCCLGGGTWGDGSSGAEPELPNVGTVGGGKMP